MTCPLCGKEYSEAEATRGCRGCPMSGGCGKLRCPGCGYESLKEPALLKLIRKTRRSRHAA